MSRLRLVCRGFGLALCVLGLVLPAPAAALEQRLIAADGAELDRFGLSAAVDGDTLVVGAPADDIGANANQGAVYVFVRFVDSWVQRAKLTASDGAPVDLLGGSVAIEGDVIVAGAPGDDVGPNAGQGSVYTFARTGAASRSETAKLTASDGTESDQLGTSVAIDGDVVVSGAFFADVGANMLQGAVYTFARTGAAARNQTAKLTASDGGVNDRLGNSVAVDGDVIVAGAYFADVAGQTDQGAAYTFARTGPAARSETAKLTASDGEALEYFATSVAIDGDVIVAGAPVDDVDATNEGSAYTFARTGAAARSETAKLTASDGAADDNLGGSVAIDGGVIVAGAPGENADQGSVYMFARAGAAARSETAKLVATGGAAGDSFGLPVALDGGVIVAGANQDDVGANTDQGSTSVFFAPAPAPAPASVPLRPGACANTRLGSAAADMLVGTPAGDRLSGLGGSDFIAGLAGDDCLFGGIGADGLQGDAGNDRLEGEGGSDRAAGGVGRDRLIGGSSNDRLVGDAGNDRLSGGSGKDNLSAGSGDDRLSGGSRGDRLVGASGDDRLSGGSGDDRLSGGSGRDRLTAGKGRNRLSGGSGSDRLNSRNGRTDRVNCGRGRDRVRADRFDILRGCEGTARR